VFLGTLVAATPSTSCIILNDDTTPSSHLTDATSIARIIKADMAMGPNTHSFLINPNIFDDESFKGMDGRGNDFMASLIFMDRGWLWVA
jgi:hypothetical protein